MQHILIVADGIIAERFINRIGGKRIGGNRYTIVAPRPLGHEPQLAPNLTLHRFDPTSRSKLTRLLHTHDFSVAFIVMDRLEEARATLENLRAEADQCPIVLLDRWGAFAIAHGRALHVIAEDQLVASRLYDQLPNVPVVAQNVGLMEGEIMEVLVPYGSSFAYRHVGSITQAKWRIAAIYREGKLILPTHATMIRPQDTLLILGKPQVLSSMYHRIRQKEGRFPEPFGRNLYLILDLAAAGTSALEQLEEGIHLAERLDGATLIVRVIRPSDFALLDAIRDHAHARIDLYVTYGDTPIREVILNDRIRFDIGMMLMTPQLFAEDAVAEEMLAQRKLVLLFGDTPLYRAERSVVLMGDEAEMESISSTLFYASEALDLNPCLCQYDPEGDFASGTIIVEHYEALARIFQYPISLEQKTVNPIRAINAMSRILHIIPLTPALLPRGFFRFLSTRPSDYFLRATQHPKLLIPADT